MNPVHVCISDLFFNYDLSDCYEGEDADFAPVPGKLTEKAEEVLGLLAGLGVSDLPTAEELLEDYFRRI